MEIYFCNWHYWARILMSIFIIGIIIVPFMIGAVATLRNRVQKILWISLYATTYVLFCFVWFSLVIPSMYLG